MKTTVLVTGANRGIGFATAKLLAEEYGMRVLMGVRDIHKGEKAQDQIQGETVLYQMNLDNPEILETQLKKILSSENKIDVLINNAGILRQGTLENCNEHDFQETVQVNFLAPYTIIKSILPVMRKNNFGRIVNISSGWGAFSEGLDGPGSYSVTKAALNALTLSFSHSLPESIKINSICPGWVKTDMGGSNAPLLPEEAAKSVAYYATLSPEGPSGGFFRGQIRLDW
jgi:NAD(P)-dependent dehydrogenase (short-subunit alcohol dehydrogenase family)